MPNDPVIVTLLTDFGLRDAYVGVVKGVILSRAPAARLVDLTHHIEQGDIAAAGYLLSTAWPFFPVGSVHLTVVDPGVGSGRRILAANVAGHHFIAPDNGLLSEVFDQHEPQHVVSIENDSLSLKPVSTTFHGRDLLAPAAAAVANGMALDSLGPAVTSWFHLPRLSPDTHPDGSLTGQVIYIDRFGNLITNITARDLDPFDPDHLHIHLPGRAIRSLSPSYASVRPGEALALIGSSQRLEISVNRGDAAAELRATVGLAVQVRPAQHAASPTPGEKSP